METLRSMRERLGLTQQTAAERLGVSQTWVKKMELGETKEPSADYVQKMAKLYDTSPDRVLTASKRMAAISDFLDGVPAALKGADSDDIAKVAMHLQRINNDPNIPNALRSRAVKAMSDHDSAIKDSLSQMLAAGHVGVAGGVRPGVAGVGPLDPTDDPQGLKVAQDGRGNWYVVDTTTDPPHISPASFGDMVQQVGEPLGTKSAGNPRRDGSYRDAFGHKRKGQ